MEINYKEAHTCKKTVLPNGLRVITEEVPFMQSVSLGIWVRCGSRYEEPDVNGICHFIEHMLFKGTDRRSAYAIAREIDSVGGVLNAFTSKELTSFYCKVIKDKLELAVDLLTDLFLNASFPDEEIEREKQVVCQEIYQLEDSPEDLVHEILGTRSWGKNPLGQPVLGTVPGLMKLDRETIVRFKNQAYSTTNTIVCAAGNVNHAYLVDLIDRSMGRLTAGPDRQHTPAGSIRPAVHVLNRDLEQVHVCVGMNGPSAVDESRHAGYILNTILGGGMSSRLFQEIREKRGLAYSVYSFLSSYSDAGLLGVYAGSEPIHFEELLRILRKETLELSSNITEDDMRTAKDHIKGNVVLAMESSEARMNRLAKGEYFFGRYIPMEEIVDSLENVTLDHLLQTAEFYLGSGKVNLVAIGPIDEGAEVFQAFQ
ncbi:M16 family metallopeptidase [Thermodesulfobacteriota bacterium]